MAESGAVAARADCGSFSRASLPPRERVRICLHGRRVLKIPEKRFDAFTVTFSSSQDITRWRRSFLGGEDRTAQERARGCGSRAADGIAVWRRQIFSRRVLHEARRRVGRRRSDGCDEPRRLRQATVRGLRAGMKQAAKNARG